MNGVVRFYDEYITRQIASGINDRIFSLYKRIKKLGLTSKTNVLEIGCGIGLLTYLLSLKIKKGKIEAIDISPKSIAFAQKHLTNPNLTLTSGNILDYKTINTNFDYILLFDVLEHIPIESHSILFKKISDTMLDHSKLLINIPNPEYIRYDQINNPGVLQEIDQPLTLDHIISALTEASLIIEYFETYSIWVKNDYQFFIITRKKEFKEELLNNQFTLVEKSRNWILRKWRKLVYNYPAKL